MNHLPDFGECLKSILDNRELTIAQAAGMLGMKSPTSLSRVLHGEVNPKTLNKLRKQLCASPEFQLTDEEKQSLHSAILVTRFGQEQVQAFGKVWDFCFPTHPAPWEIRIYVHGDDFYPPQPTFSSLTAYYSGCRELELTIIGCCSRYFLDEIGKVLSQDVHRSIRIDHYLHQSTQTPLPLAHQMQAIRSLIAFPQYNVYIGDPEKIDEYTLNMLDSNAFWVKATEKDGHVRMHKGLIVSSDEMLILEIKDEKYFSFVPDAIRWIRPRLTPVKLLFPPRTTPLDFLQYTEDFRRMEADRAIYSLIPDVCFNFIPTNICLPAAIDGFQHTAFAPSEKIGELVESLASIHEKRWNNIFHSKKVRYYILSANATRRFARTGRLSDHFFALRPFTPKERRGILWNIRENMAENPYFNLLFARDDQLNFDYELTVYEGLCVMILDSSTSYRLGQDHAEILLNQPQYQNLLIDFFRYELLAHQVHPARESLAIMDQILASVPAE